MAGLFAATARSLQRPVLMRTAVLRCRERNFSELAAQPSVLSSSSSSNFLQNCELKFVVPRSLVFGDVRLLRTSAALCEIKNVMTPTFADSVSEGDLKWQRKVGDAVKEDEVIAEVETDKTAMPVHSPAAGVITEILVPDGTTVKANTILCKIDTAAKGAPAPAAAPAAPAAPAGGAPPAAPAGGTPPATPAGGTPPSTPPATPTTPPKKASEPSSPPPRPVAPATKIPVAAIRHAHAIDSATVKLPPADPTKEISGTRTEHRVKMNRMRMKIAERLKHAQNENAMLTTFNEIDMSQIMDFRRAHLEAFVKKYGMKFGFMSVFAKASAYALQDQPVVNAVIEEGNVVYRDYVDISVAVATPKGLVVPVIRNVERMNYAEIEQAIAAMGEKARSGKLAVEDMDGGTFTISNGGVFGSLLGTPIINPPQSAILGMHGIFERPIAIKGQVVVRPMMYVALTYDHRLIDGREAVLFLRKIKAAVEDPRIVLTGL